MNQNRTQSICLSFLLGFISIISQVLLLRELISVFYGNETAYAVILASWLFWIAVGSSVVSFFIHKLQQSRRWILLGFWSILFILPLTILCIRNLFIVMDIPIGEIVGILSMTVSSFFLLAPLTFCLGALYTLICAFSQRSPVNEGPRHPEIHGVSGVYLWEAVGSALGGVVFSFVLIHFLSPLVLVCGMAVIILGICSILIDPKNFLLRTIHFVLMFFLVGLWFSGGVDKIDQWSRQQQWKGYEIVHIEDSLYGNIALLKRYGEYSLFQNGLHVFTTNDALSSEERVHYPLLTHPAPKNILLIGNGLGGSIQEILKHPQSRVDYLELDPKVIQVTEDHLPDSVTNILKSRRVRIFVQDARHFVKQTKNRYDVIILNLSDPHTALINRYYTLEFFKEAHQRLVPGGIISVSVSSSENYLNDETQEFLQSINTTLQHVYTDVKSIPGDTHIFLASNEKGGIRLDPDLLVQRLQDRQIDTQYVQSYYIPFRMSPDRMDYIQDVLQHPGQINSDARPVAYLFDIIHWSIHFNTGFKKFINYLRGIKFWQVLIVPFVLCFIGILFKRQKTWPLSLSIMTTGFSEIIYQVIVIIAFQTLYGYAYYKIGLIVSSFMIGLVFGVLAARKVLKKPVSNVIRTYKHVQCGVCVYPLFLPVLFIVFRDVFQGRYLMGLFGTVFAFLPIIAGFIGGIQYPLATYLFTRIRSEEEPMRLSSDSSARNAGYLYAMDVLGATIGAALAGIVMIPLWGINQVAIFCAVLNVFVFILILKL
ncbi:MAG: hypothetical protein K8S27_12125 [Candidatus Omnitrophica bacterium]|nr:hypothetical protein [Candidatus Omnitrophota bacterium]